MTKLKVKESIRVIESKIRRFDICVKWGELEICESILGDWVPSEDVDTIFEEAYQNGFNDGAMEASNDIHRSAHKLRQ